MKDIREALDTAIEANRPVLLQMDFGGVTFMDSSGIGLVMGRYRLIKPLGGEIHIINPPQNVSRVMKLAGMEKIAIFN